MSDWYVDHFKHRLTEQDLTGTYLTWVQSKASEPSVAYFAAATFNEKTALMIVREHNAHDLLVAACQAALKEIPDGDAARAIRVALTAAGRASL